MIYRAIGVISDSSLNGVEIAFVEFQEQGGKWGFEVVNTAIYPYSAEWVGRLKDASDTTAKKYQLLHSDYGHYLGQQVNKFIEQYELHYKTAVIGSYGHTVFDLPNKNTTIQMGDGAAIAANTALPVVSDFYAVDAALNGTERNWNILQQKLNTDVENINKAVLSAFMGVLRWREEYNVFASESGASRNSIGGALWIGQEA